MMFSVKWKLADIKQDKDVKVFSIFSCGGGSTMGYKRAGFKVIGNCELDKSMNDIYLANHHPSYNYNMDVRDFLKLEDLPDDLYSLDILDGSPPCSTFSICGKREDSWGKEKTFREGQKKQTLDDLFFVFLDVVEKLKPKVVVAENVVGIIQKKAKGYCNQIIKRFHEIGYDVQVFKLNAAFMEVPQKRERVFFVANRMNYPKLKLNFDYAPIPFGRIRSKEPGRKPGADFLEMARPCDRSSAEIKKRLGRKVTDFNSRIDWDNDVASTQTATIITLRGYDKTYYTLEDVVAVQTFPEDFNFINNHVNNVRYVCGMSVPPNMMAHIANQIWRQWLRGD